MELPFAKTGPCLTDEEVLAYLGRTAPDAGRIEAHLAGCADCLDLLLATRSAEAEVPERTVQRVLALRARRVPSIRRLPRRKTNPLLSLAAAAAVLAVTLLAVFALARKRPAPKPEPAPQADRPREERKAPPDEKKEIVEKKPGEKKEVVEKKPDEKKPEEKKEIAKGVADILPGPTTETTAERERVAVTAVVGRVRMKDRDLKAGDTLDGEPLRTEFGDCAKIEAGGGTIWVHHETELSLAPGMVQVSSGRIFARDLRAETPAGTITPAGTAYAVEVSGNVTTVVVREGAVQFRSTRGEQRVEKGQMSKCAAGQAPSRPARAGEVAWVDQIDRATGGDAWLVLYPAKRKSPILVTAPHMPIETQSAKFATGLARRLETSLVVAYGYKKTRKIEVNVPGDDGGVFQEYCRLIREGASQSPAPFLIEIHGYGDADDPPVLEISTSGFTKADCERLKAVYARLLKKHAPEIEATLIFDQTDAGKIKFPAGDMRTRGVFRKEIAERGWKVELPHACRWKCHDAYVAILADLVESMR